MIYDPTEHDRKLWATQVRYLACFLTYIIFAWFEKVCEYQKP